MAARPRWRHNTEISTKARFGLGFSTRGRDSRSVAGGGSCHPRRSGQAGRLFCALRSRVLAAADVELKTSQITYIL
jgi:hypothetical protein